MADEDQLWMYHFDIGDLDPDVRARLPFVAVCRGSCPRHHHIFVRRGDMILVTGGLDGPDVGLVYVEALLNQFKAITYIQSVMLSQVVAEIGAQAPHPRNFHYH